MEIIMRKASDLIPYAQNTKKHDQKQIDNVANSIRRFGWQQPIVIDENNVVVIGHCRLLAAKKLKQKEVPCTVASGLTEQEIRELRIADNKTNQSRGIWKCWMWSCRNLILRGLSLILKPEKTTLLTTSVILFRWPMVENQIFVK